MCHESSGTALTESIGVGKGSVSLDDIHEAKLLVIVGQNPGTNHPRMLTALEKAKSQRRPDHRGQPAAGGRADAVPEPADRHAAWSPAVPPLADTYLQIKVGGDLALFQAIGALLIEWGAIDDDVRRGQHRRLRRLPSRAGEARLGRRPGVDRTDPRARSTDAAQAVRRVARPPSCAGRWASPSARTAVAAIREIANVQLLRGMIGKPGAGLCPVRGHSNVQGDRTMGDLGEAAAVDRRRWASCSASQSPTEARLRHGGTRSARCATARSACSWRSAATSRPRHRTPRSPRRPSRNCALTVHVSTKLNRSHVVHRPDRADPAVPRPHRARHPGQRRPVRHRRGLDVGGARLARQRSRPPRRSCGPRWRSCAGSPRPRSATR